MGHRLSFKGWLGLWGLFIFYLFMLVTNPITVGGATIDVVMGVASIADDAGEALEDARDEADRDRLEDDVRAELEDQLRCEIAAELFGAPESTNGDRGGQGVIGDRVADALPDPQATTDLAVCINDQIGDGLADNGLTLATENGEDG